jgi:hypothetical protein
MKGIYKIVKTAKLFLNTIEYEKPNPKTLKTLHTPNAHFYNDDPNDTTLQT